jgi:hypothetical protein
MKNIKLIVGLMIMGSLLTSESALAGHGYGGHGYGGHGGRGGNFGFGLYTYYPYPYYPYAYPYSYYPPVVVTPSQPTVYVEQDTSPPNSQQMSPVTENYYWYHCDKPDGYYPYVKECPSGWQKVTPTPPTQ